MKYNIDWKGLVTKYNYRTAEAICCRHKDDPANFLDRRSESGVIGNSFAALLAEDYPSMFFINPHSDGHPDVLPPYTECPEILPWITVPTKKHCPYGLFDAKSHRIEYGERFNVCASAHHRKTRALLNIVWTKLNNIPIVLGLAYAEIIKEDWRKVTKPKTDESGTTSGTGVNGKGLKKLRTGWIIMDKSYTDTFGIRSIEDYHLS